MKKFLVAVLVISAMLSAAFVDQSKAQKVAENYYQNYAPASAKGNTVQKITQKVYNGQVTWYAVSFDQGFVIVSADDAVRSILGYSYKGEIADDFYNMQNPFVNRFDAYDKQIVEARETGYVDTKAQTEWKNLESNIFPKASKAIVVDALVESKWGQGWPMNTLCPLDGGVETAVGCVATAMHQIMRYHMAPLNGISSHSYFWTGSSSSGTLAVTFADYSYDYDLMPLTTSSVTQAELDELSKLSYHCGVAVDMDYDIFANGGSGAFSTDVPYALETYFGFSTDATFVSVGSPTDPTVQSTNIQNDLDNGRPIYWSGSGVDGGHAFVLDGYTDDYYYHFNWGWNGSSDGWFQLTSLNPSSDFTSSQGAVYQIWSTESLFLDWPTPTNLGGSVANQDDVTLTWTAPSASPNATLTGYRVFREGIEIGTTNASTTTYLDADLSAGYYNYTVKATYTGPDGESHISNNYYVAIAADENYPIPLYVDANVEAFTRQDVDLTWTKPFTLAIYFQEDWETTSFETDWIIRRTNNEFGGNNDNFKTADADPRWSHCDEATYGDAQYIHSGLYSATLAYFAGTSEWEWLFSPFINIGANAEVRFWTWSYGTATNPGYYDVNLYNGDMTERSPTANIYNVAQYQNIDVDLGNTNVYEFEEVVSLAAYTGSYRLAFVRQSGQWQFCIDDIIVAASAKSAPAVNPNPPSTKPVLFTGDLNSADTTGLPAIKNTKAAKADEPISYDIYRNGSFVENVAVTGASEVYSDTGFIDGDNEYYVKALYPTGTSIASNRSTAFMDANPKPDFLTGVLNGSNDVDLTWYKPYHNAPIWYTYAYEADSYYDYLEGYLSQGFKTRFLGDELGYFYPVTVDSICAAFGEYTDVPWTSNNFTFTINTRAYDGTDSILWGPSGTLTAVDGEFTTVAVPSLVMNTYWYVVVTPGDTSTGHPAIITDIHEEPGAGSESTTWIDNQVDTEGWYGIIFGDEGYPGDWMIMSYVTSSASPDITKSGWMTNSQDIVEREIPQLAKKIVNNVVPEIESKAKGMTNYNIYRNGSLLGTSATLTYTDLNPINGDNTYYVTALYDNPVGESVGSNSIVINVAGGPVIPEVPANVVTSISGTNLVIDWDISADATGYDVYSSDDPYGTFTFVTSVGTNQYTVAASQAKLFYYIVATNATKK